MNPLKTRKNADAQRAKKRHAICLLNNTIGRQGQTRLPACLSGAFCPSHLDGRQPACGSKAKNHSKMHRRQVRSSFAGAEMCPDKESPAGNTCRISKEHDAVWAHFCPSKPCLPLSADGKLAKKKSGPRSPLCENKPYCSHYIIYYLPMQAFFLETKAKRRRTASLFS